MPSPFLKDYLDSHHIPHKCIEHGVTVTAQQTAHLMHIKGNEMVKTVIVNLDDRMAMFVLPAPDRVNVDRVKQSTGAHHVAVAEERDIHGLFPDCETGAMPPFGNLYGLEVFVQKDLTEDDEIAFNAGNHHEIIKLRYRDFASLVHPTVGDFISPRRAH